VPEDQEIFEYHIKELGALRGKSLLPFYLKEEELKKQ